MGFSKFSQVLFLRNPDQDHDRIKEARITILAWGYLLNAIGSISLLLVVIINDIHQPFVTMLVYSCLNIGLFYLLLKYNQWLIQLTHIKILILMLLLWLNAFVIRDKGYLLMDSGFLFQIMIFAFFILRGRKALWYAILSTIPILFSFLYNKKTDSSDLLFNFKGGHLVYAIAIFYSLLFIAISLHWMIRAFKATMNQLHRQAGTLKEQSEELQTQSEELRAQSEELQSINEELYDQKAAEHKARKEADLANQAKSAFLAIMSHEIRTPMNGVLGMTDLLRQTSLDGEQEEYTESIRISGEALLNVINDILDFSKIESGKLEIDQHTFELRTCIEEVIDLLSGQAALTGLDLLYQIDPQIPALLIGDSFRLRQVLINIIGNAIKFTKEGEVFIGVTLLQQTTDGHLKLSFEVRDTGIGIPADKLPRLFKSFSQVDASTSRHYGGTGLGLAISERLVNLMGGEISVTSVESKGTSFFFNIVCLEDKENKPAEQSSLQPDIQGKRILVVDDNATNRRILKIQLEQWQLVPVMASSGKEALELLEKDVLPDLVITDMQMPGMDGLELGLRMREKYANMPIILLSSIGDERKKKLSGLFTAILTKPVKYLQLLNVILSALKLQPEKQTPEVKAVPVLTVQFASDHPLQLLVAEDNEINQKLIMRVLHKLGYEPVLANNGVEVLQLLDSMRIDVIFMDVQMPEMDGMEATRYIRQQKKHQVVIVAMTANAMAEDEEACLTAGMDYYISKPISIEKLVYILNQISTTLKAASSQLHTSGK
jgi:signal transduction histidine kinase/CheY-like chemotaxis protein